jgi:hypothetical protein
MLGFCDGIFLVGIVSLRDFGELFYKVSLGTAMLFQGVRTFKSDVRNRTLVVFCLCANRDWMQDSENTDELMISI